MACRFPGAATVEEFWDNLIAVRDTVQRGPEAGGSFVGAAGKVSGQEAFDSEYFRVTPAEAELMDPQQRVLLEVAVEAMEDAGYGGDDVDPDSGPVIGVFVGGGGDEYLHEFAGPASGRDVFEDLRLRTGNGKDFLAARLAFKLGFGGPSVTVQAGCATGLVAVATACNALLLGDCDIAIAGGISLLMPDATGYRYEAGGILSRDGYCRPFDAAADGTVPSSGVGLVVLRRDEDATRDGDTRRAILRGWAVNNDGRSRSGFTVPNVDGQARVVRRALDRASATASDIGFLETHGTATAVGDAVEIDALKQNFGEIPTDQACVLGAVKANIGHTDSAAGIAGLIKAALVVERGIIPGTVNFTRPNELLDLDASPFTISADTTYWTRPGERLAGVSSFALGGNNAHVIVARPTPRPTVPTRVGAHAIALSARTPAGLEHLKAATRRWVADAPQMPSEALADAAFTLAVGRRRHEYRWVGVATDADHARRLLATPTAPAPTVLRRELLVAGTASEVSDLAGGELASHPVYLATVTVLESELGEGPTREREPAFVVLAVLRSLERLGLTFARLDGPTWIGPLFEWHDADPVRRRPLSDALDACARLLGGDRGATAEPRVGGDSPAPSPGRVVLDEDFSLTNAAAEAWATGADIDLARLYEDEHRQRIPLPTYPFERRDHTLPRRESRQAPPSTAAREEQPRSLDVNEVMTEIWQRVLGLESIDIDAHFLDDLGGDSMYAVEIGGQLNDALGVNLPIDLPFEAPTIRQAVAIANATLSTRAELR